jgi:hypothetical protein
VRLMRRLSSTSRKKPDSGLRARVTAATNKAEAYNGFSAWTRFGKQGVIAGNDRPSRKSRSNGTRCYAT